MKFIMNDKYSNHYDQQILDPVNMKWYEIYNER